MFGHRFINFIEFFLLNCFLLTKIISFDSHQLFFMKSMNEDILI